MLWVLATNQFGPAGGFQASRSRIRKEIGRWWALRGALRHFNSGMPKAQMTRRSQWRRNSPHENACDWLIRTLGHRVLLVVEGNPTRI